MRCYRLTINAILVLGDTDCSGAGRNQGIGHGTWGTWA